jgi:DNA-directed RNA polymerase delta subunit
MNINYQKICSELIRGLPQRTADVVERRFGLKGGERETLESIGQSYGITRERVRQIENEGFSHILPRLENYKEVFQQFDGALDSFGGLKKEGSLLTTLGGEAFKNEVYFLLTINKDFHRITEDDKFYSLWTKDEKSLKVAEKIVAVAVKNLENEKKPIELDKLYSLSSLGEKNIFASSIEISKDIKRNPEGLVGLCDWVEMSPRGIKDRAYLVLKKEEKPLHFTEVASCIEKLPLNENRKVHVATVHNELIKDTRFVLVGRGLYALAEWGYQPGVVKEIISKVLKESKKPLTKEEIVEKVLGQRFVKENTVALNLQDKNRFVKDDKGRYNVREA